MNNKKGVELGTNTFIIIVLGILVLLILAYFIIKGTSTYNSGVSCEPPKGRCVDKNAGCSDGETKGPWACKDNEVCCVQIR